MAYDLNGGSGVVEAVEPLVLPNGRVQITRDIPVAPEGKQFIGLSGRILRRGYALLFAFVFIFYIGMAAMPALLMASGHDSAGKLIYRGFHFLCHQYPWRSWYLKGEQPYYPLISSEGSGIKSIEEASGMTLAEIHPRTFYGNPQMGYKTASCQRDIAIYGGMALFCLLFCLTAMRIRPPKLILPVLIGVLPIAADGGTQLLGNVFQKVFPFRESDPLLRTVTGALFGFCLCWYLIPLLERSLQEKEKYDRS